MSRINELNKRSPIYYQGSKYKLLNRLKEYIPNEIETFYDLFGGSATMSLNMNYKAKKIVYNEFNRVVYNAVKYIRENDPTEIANAIKNVFLEYDIRFVIDKNNTATEQEKER